jgi:hypothetical protein
MVVLEEARNVNYKSFVSPGRTLEVTAEAVEIAPAWSDFKTFGRSGDEEMVKARIRLRHYNLSERNAAMADVDERLTADLRKRFELLGGPAACKRTEALAAQH